jgi:hypothetical protein
MTLTLELPKGEEAAWKEEADRLGLTPEELVHQAVMDRLLAALKNRRVPQSLEDLQPRRMPPPGKTAMEMVFQKLDTDETDDEIRQALAELS